MNNYLLRIGRIKSESIKDQNYEKAAAARDLERYFAGLSFQFCEYKYEDINIIKKSYLRSQKLNRIF
jgi:hypothetical protein